MTSLDVASMERLRDGDDLALNEIMDRWQRRVTSFLFRLTGNEAVALDLAQETFVKVYQARTAYRPSGEFSTWLFTIAANLGNQHFRWARRHPTVSLDDTIVIPPGGGPNPDCALDGLERANLVRRAVMSLPVDLRQAVVLFEYEDLSHQQIAAICECSPKAIETRLYRARGMLKAQLGRLLEKS